MSLRLKMDLIGDGPFLSMDLLTLSRLCCMDMPVHRQWWWGASACHMNAGCNLSMEVSCESLLLAPGPVDSERSHIL